MSERPPVPTPQEAFGAHTGAAEPFVDPANTQMSPTAEPVQSNGHVAKNEQATSEAESNPGLLSAEQREQDMALMGITDRRELSETQRAEMQKFKLDPYMTPGTVFGSYKRAAQNRLSRDDELRNPQPVVPAVVAQPAPKPRALSRVNRADLEAVANARSRGEASDALNKEDLPKNSPLRKLELSPIDTKHPTSALESLRAVRENAREQLIRDDAVKAQLSQARAAVAAARRQVVHEKTLVDERDQWKADDAAVAKAEQGILNSWKFKHGGEAGLKHELARKDSDLMERVQRQARARVLGGDEKAVSQPAQPRSAEVISPSATQHEENKKTVKALNNFYRQQLLGSAAAGSPDAKTAPRALEAHGPFTNMDLLQFKDNELGFSYSEPGTEITFGIGSMNRYATDLPFENGSHRAIVYTTGGEKYGFGAGRVIKMSTGEAVEFPQGADLKFTVGEKFKLPGATEETVVEEVLVRGMTGPEGLNLAEQVPGGNPFTQLREKLANVGVTDPTKTMPLVPQPTAQKAPAPEKRKGKLLAAAIGTLALGAVLFGGLTAMNSEDAPHKEASEKTHDLTDEERNRSDDMSVELGKMVQIDVERNNGPTQEIKQLAAKQGIKASPQQFYDSYKKFADQGRFDNIEGMYLMENGDFGFASAGAHELPADLVNDILEDLKKSTK